MKISRLFILIPFLLAAAFILWACQPTASPTGSNTEATAPASDSPVLVWQRQGGIAGFCDEVVVYGNGLALVGSCKSNAGIPAQVQLSAAEAAQLTEWISTYQSFEDIQQDPAVADAIYVRLAFTGGGQAEASDVVRQDMLSFVTQIGAR